MAKVYEIKKGLKAYSKGIVRLVTKVSKKRGEEFVEYKVLHHAQPGRIGSSYTVKRRSFVKWLKGVKPQKEEFKPGDILIFDEEKIQVIENKGLHGTIRPFGSNNQSEDVYMKNFYWSGASTMDCIKIGHAPLS